MANVDVKICVKVRWWVLPYFRVLAFLCAVMGTEPDLDKAKLLVRKHGLKIMVG